MDKLDFYTRFKMNLKSFDVIKYFKMNLKSIIILIYLKILRLYSINILQLKYFNKDWFISISSSLFSLNLNQMIGTDITNKILNIYDKKYVKARETITVSLSIFYILFFKYIYMRLFFRKNILNKKYIQVTVISILSISFYSITIKPLFNDTRASKFFNSIISDTILLLSSDFIEDASIDSGLFDIEVSTIGTFFRIIVNSFIKL